MFTHIKCQNTLDGKLLTWDILEGHTPSRISIYGSYEGKQWTLLENDCLVNWFIDPTRTLGLTALYKIVGIDNVGNRYEVNNIGATHVDSKAGLLAKELHRRERVLYKTHPYSRVDVIILMRKNSGNICPECGDINCPTSGPNISCANCYGTGIVGGYFKYPKTEPMLMLDAHDDKLQPAENIVRNGAIQHFRTVFTGLVREKDILCIGMDLYTVISSQCVLAAGTIPVAYNIQAVKLLPDSVLYKTLLEDLKNE
jgi:hypothetical protein